MLLKVCNGAILLFKLFPQVGDHLVTGKQELLQIGDNQLFFLELIQQVMYLLLLFALALFVSRGKKRILIRQTQFLFEAGRDMSSSSLKLVSGEILTKVGLDLDPVSLTIGTPIGSVTSASWILAPRVFKTDRETARATKETKGGLTREQSHPVDIIGFIGQSLTLSRRSDSLYKILLFGSKQEANLIDKGFTHLSPRHSSLSWRPKRSHDRGKKLQMSRASEMRPTRTPQKPINAQLLKDSAEGS
jgi:hypothetical protein